MNKEIKKGLEKRIKRNTNNIIGKILFATQVNITKYTEVKPNVYYVIYELGLNQKNPMFYILYKYLEKKEKTDKIRYYFKTEYSDTIRLKDTNF